MKNVPIIDLWTRCKAGIITQIGIGLLEQISYVIQLRFRALTVVIVDEQLRTGRVTPLGRLTGRHALHMFAFHFQPRENQVDIVVEPNQLLEDIVFVGVEIESRAIGRHVIVDAAILSSRLSYRFARLVAMEKRTRRGTDASEQRIRRRRRRTLAHRRPGRLHVRCRLMANIVVVLVENLSLVQQLS